VAREYWGVGCNAFGFEPVNDEPGHFKCGFITEWDPPVPVLEKLPEIFPNLGIEVYGYEYSWPPSFGFEGKTNNGEKLVVYEIDEDEIQSDFVASSSPPRDGRGWVVTKPYDSRAELGEFTTEEEANAFVERLSEEKGRR
jgi:hypothetical protein